MREQWTVSSLFLHCSSSLFCRHISPTLAFEWHWRPPILYSTSAWISVLLIGVKKLKQLAKHRICQLNQLEHIKWGIVEYTVIYWEIITQAGSPNVLQYQYNTKALQYMYMTKLEFKSINILFHGWGLYVDGQVRGLSLIVGPSFNKKNQTFFISWYNCDGKFH